MSDPSDESLYDLDAEAALYATFDRLGIRTKTITHQPAFTVEQSQEIMAQLEADPSLAAGACIKNLFLRDKKKTLWLVTVLEDRAVDLKALRSALDARGNLSFGSPDLLKEVLGVTPGSVTPFAALKDTDNRATVILDKAIFEAPSLNAHPLRNDKTTNIACDDLLTLLRHFGKEPVILDFTTLMIASSENTEAAGP